MIVIAIIAVIAAIAIPNLVQARKASNETSAIASLRMIASAQVLYKERTTATYATSLSQLGNVTLVDANLVAGYKSGYNFTTAVAPTDPGNVYWANGDPVSPGGSGDRYFAVGIDGVIFYTTAGPIAVNVVTGKMPAGAVALGK